MSNLSKYLNLSNYVTRINFYLNKYILVLIRKPFVKLGFVNYFHIHIHGAKERLIYDKNSPISLSNTIFNTRSGIIELEKYVMFGHNCMVLTGTHNYNAALESLSKLYEVPEEGRNIKIGEATWITSGCIILGGGDNW